MKSGASSIKGVTANQEETIEDEISDDYSNDDGDSSSGGFIWDDVKAIVQKNVALLEEKINEIKIENESKM